LASLINVKVTVKNITDKEIYLGPSGVQMGWRLHGLRVLADEDGREVKTRLSRKFTGRQRPDDPVACGLACFKVLPHPPGLIYQMTIDSKRLYEIKEPGVYTLEVSRFDQTIRQRLVPIH